MSRKLAFFALLFGLLPGCSVQAADGIVTRVIDADTYAILVFPDDAPGIALVRRYRSKRGFAWDGIHVRLRGVDTPESFQPKCDFERRLAAKAKRFVKEVMLKPGQHVKVENIEFGKYAGRVVADVLVFRDGAWRQLADELIESGFAYRYDGGTKQSWCEGRK